LLGTADHSSEGAAILQPGDRDRLRRTIVRKEHSARLGSVSEEGVVVRFLTEDIYGALDVPPAGYESLDEWAADVLVAE
jgi:hypothetical protein